MLRIYIEAIILVALMTTGLVYAPALISASDTILMILGFALIVVLIPVLFLLASDISRQVKSLIDAKKGS